MGTRDLGHPPACSRLACTELRRVSGRVPGGSASSCRLSVGGMACHRHWVSTQHADLACSSRLAAVPWVLPGQTSAPSTCWRASLWLARCHSLSRQGMPAGCMVGRDADNSRCRGQGSQRPGQHGTPPGGGARCQTAATTAGASTGLLAAQRPAPPGRLPRLLPAHLRPAPQLDLACLCSACRQAWQCMQTVPNSSLERRWTGCWRACHQDQVPQASMPHG